MTLASRIRRLETIAGIHSGVDDIPISVVIVETREQVAILKKLEEEEGDVSEMAYPKGFEGQMSFDQFMEFRVGPGKKSKVN